MIKSEEMTDLHMYFDILSMIRGVHACFFFFFFVTQKPFCYVYI